MQLNRYMKRIASCGYTAKVGGILTAPLKFAVWSNDMDAVVIPKVSVEEIKAGD